MTLKYLSIERCKCRQFLPVDRWSGHQEMLVKKSHLFLRQHLAWMKALNLSLITWSGSCGHRRGGGSIDEGGGGLVTLVALWSRKRGWRVGSGKDWRKCIGWIKWIRQCKWIVIDIRIYLFGRWDWRGCWLEIVIDRRRCGWGSRVELLGCVADYGILRVEESPVSLGLNPGAWFRQRIRGRCSVSARWGRLLLLRLLLLLSVTLGTQGIKGKVLRTGLGWSGLTMLEVIEVIYEDRYFFKFVLSWILSYFWKFRTNTFLTLLFVMYVCDECLRIMFGHLPTIYF